MSSLDKFETRYHALTVLEDDVICAMDSGSADYGGSSVMLVKFNKLTQDDAMIIREHLTNVPTDLRVMHGGLQVSGQSTPRSPPLS